MALTVATATALPGGLGAQILFQKNERQQQREAAGRLAPQPFVLPQMLGQRAPAVIRLRFYADAEYRSTGPNWRDQVKAQLGRLNQLVGPALGVRFEAVDWKRWERRSGNQTLTPMLTELAKLDPGLDVDWVVGLVSPLPLVSMSFHDLGWANVLGRHFVLRGMSDARELDDLRRYYQKLDPAEVAALYGKRKAHKELAIFLHEWGHTLGAFHVQDRTHLMNAAYSPQAHRLSPADAGLWHESAMARIRSRGLDAVDYSGLRVYLLETNDPLWPPRERQFLLSQLPKAPARRGPPGLSEEALAGARSALGLPPPAKRGVPRGSPVLAPRPAPRKKERQPGGVGGTAR